jgi:hypothetical protein
MEKNFFDLVKSNFFRPLSGSTKEVNYLLLKMINDNIQDSVDYVERSEILNWIISFCKSRPKSIMLDDETETLETDVKKFASNKLAYFEKCGWLTTERANDFKVRYQLESAAIEIINAMSNVETSESKTNEYTGYVFDIYSKLMNFDTERGTETIERMLESSKKLNDSLRIINNSIKKYLNALLNNENMTAGEILKTLLVDYQKNVVAHAFNNLRLEDNPSKYRRDIIHKIDEILDECVGRLIENYVKVKFGGDRSGDNQNQAQEYITNSLNVIKEQFENIEKSLTVIYERNTKYVTTATSRLNYLINEEVNIEGKIYDILKAINTENISTEEYFEFSLKEFGRIDDSSLSNYTKKKAKVGSKVIPHRPEIDPEDKRKEQEKLLRQAEFSIININKFICKQLADKESIEAKDISLSSYDDLIKLFLAQIYAGSEHVQYDVKNENGFFVYNNSKMTNFTIYRRDV